MPELTLPFVYISISGFFLGTFGLGMKRIAPLSWEMWWLMYSIAGMLLIPVVWAYLAVPGLFGILSAPVSSEGVFWGALFGFLWGIGGITFGLSVEAVGMALTYGIVMGLSSAIGSLVPFLRQGGGSGTGAPVFITALTLMLVGVGICTYAGVRRERTSAVTAGRSTSRGFAGLGIAMVSGVMSSLLAVGFDMAAPIVDAASQMGVEGPNISLARWLAVCAGAFLMNAGYAVFLMVRSRSWVTLRNRGAGQSIGFGLLAGAFWFLSFGVSGLGMQRLGPLGLPVGWPMLLGIGLIVSTCWSLAMGEWKGANSAFRIMAGGILVLIVSICLLGYARSVA